MSADTNPAACSWIVSGAGDNSFNGTYQYVSNDVCGNPYYSNGIRYLGLISDKRWWTLSYQDDQPGPNCWANFNTYRTYYQPGATRHPAVLPNNDTYWINTSTLNRTGAPTVIPGAGCANTFTISSFVKEQGTNTAIAGATVNIAGKTATKASNGGFTIADIPFTSDSPAAYSLSVTKTGYNTIVSGLSSYMAGGGIQPGQVYGIAIIYLTPIGSSAPPPPSPVTNPNRFDLKGALTNEANQPFRGPKIIVSAESNYDCFAIPRRETFSTTSYSETNPNVNYDFPNLTNPLIMNSSSCWINITFESAGYFYDDNNNGLDDDNNAPLRVQITKSKLQIKDNKYVLYQNISLTKKTPTLTVNLTANPNSGAAPLESSITAIVSGTATGTINYTFWWNCNDNSVAVQETIRRCGDPLTAVNGVRTVGTKFDNITETTKTVRHAYREPGEYTPKIIVERDGAPPATAKVPMVVNPPRTTINGKITDVNGAVLDSVHSQVMIGLKVNGFHGNETDPATYTGGIEHVIRESGLQQANLTTSPNNNGDYSFTLDSELFGSRNKINVEICAIETKIMDLHDSYYSKCYRDTTNGPFIFSLARGETKNGVNLKLPFDFAKIDFSKISVAGVISDISGNLLASTVGLFFDPTSAVPYISTESLIKPVLDIGRFNFYFRDIDIPSNGQLYIKIKKYHRDFPEIYLDNNKNGEQDDEPYYQIDLNSFQVHTAPDNGRRIIYLNLQAVQMINDKATEFVDFVGKIYGYDKFGTELPVSDSLFDVVIRSDNTGFRKSFNIVGSGLSYQDLTDYIDGSGVEHKIPNGWNYKQEVPILDGQKNIFYISFKSYTKSVILKDTKQYGFYLSSDDIKAKAEKKPNSNHYIYNLDFEIMLNPYAPASDKLFFQLINSENNQIIPIVQVSLDEYEEYEEDHPDQFVYVSDFRGRWESNFLDAKTQRTNIDCIQDAIIENARQGIFSIKLKPECSSRLEDFRDFELLTTYSAHPWAVYPQMADWGRPLTNDITRVFLINELRSDAAIATYQKNGVTFVMEARHKNYYLIDTTALDKASVLISQWSQYANVKIPHIFIGSGHRTGISGGYYYLPNVTADNLIGLSLNFLLSGDYAILIHEMAHYITNGLSNNSYTNFDRNLSLAASNLNKNNCSRYSFKYYCFNSYAGVNEQENWAVFVEAFMTEHDKLVAAMNDPAVSRECRDSLKATYAFLKAYFPNLPVYQDMYSANWNDTNSGGGRVLAATTDNLLSQMNNILAENGYQVTIQANIALISNLIYANLTPEQMAAGYWRESIYNTLPITQKARIQLTVLENLVIKAFNENTTIISIRDTLNVLNNSIESWMRILGFNFSSSSINGTVFDQNGRIQPGVRVRVGKKSAITNVNGYYVIRRLHTGKQEITVSDPKNNNQLFNLITNKGFAPSISLNVQQDTEYKNKNLRISH